MMRTNHKLLIFFMLIVAFFLLITSGCTEKEEGLNQEQYQNCTAVCAVAIDSEGEEFTTLYYCNEECKNKFLES